MRMGPNLICPDKKRQLGHRHAQEAKGRHEEKVAIYQPRKEVSKDTDSDLQNCQIVHFCCLHLPVCVALLRQTSKQIHLPYTTHSEDKRLGNVSVGHECLGTVKWKVQERAWSYVHQHIPEVMCPPTERLCPKPESHITCMDESCSHGSSSETQGSWFSEQHSKTHKETYLQSALSPCKFPAVFTQLLKAAQMRGFSTSPLRNPHWEQVQESAFRLENSVTCRSTNSKNWATDIGDIGNERKKDHCKFSRMWNLSVKVNIRWLVTCITL